MPEKGDLNEAAWRDVNEAVGEAMGVSPPDPVADRPPLDAPAHGASPAKLVPSSGRDATTPEAQPKLEDNGVRFQMVRAQDLADVAARQRLDRLRLEVERHNREAAARAHPAFRKDGSLAGEYAPLEGDATTPDTVDGVWWLGLPKTQAMWELGLTTEAEYLRVYRDVEAMAYMVENRVRQTGEYIPLVLKRRRRRENTALFYGGRVHRIKPMTDPDDKPGRRRP
jgi:hypothetical protein